MFIRDWSTPSNFIITPQSTLNTIGKTYVFREAIKKRALRITIAKSGEVWTSISIIFHHRAVMYHKFEDVNLINRRCKTSKTNQITPAYLRSIPCIAALRYSETLMTSPKPPYSSTPSFEAAKQKFQHLTAFVKGRIEVGPEIVSRCVHRIENNLLR